jgi:Ca2+-binding RTX toxin-like protein
VGFADDRVILSFSSGRPNPTSLAVASSGGSVSATPTTLSLEFVDASPYVRIEARDRGTGRFNFIQGSDPSKWHIGASVYAAIVYRDVWPGVDLVFRGRGGTLKYDVIVRPGAEIDDIEFAYRGASSSLEVASNGSLLIPTAMGTLREAIPFSFQVRDGKRSPVASRFVLQGSVGDISRFGFDLGPGYDPRRRLVIDPEIVYSTFLGIVASGELAATADGVLFVAGGTRDPGFPTTDGAFSRSLQGWWDLYVAKFDPTGTLIYATLLGGEGQDWAMGIGLGGDGSVFVAGGTKSVDFPTTPGAFDRTLSATHPEPDAHRDAFVTRISPSGSDLIYSTFVGGQSVDEARDLSVDDDGNAYIGGFTYSDDFPATPGAFDTSFTVDPLSSTDAFAAKLDPGGSALFYSTFLGGEGEDFGQAVAVDDEGELHVAGSTGSDDFPTSAGGTTPRNFEDAFILELDAAGSDLKESDVFGGSNSEIPRAIALDASGDIYLSGESYSTDFPTTVDAFDTSFNGGTVDVFVTKVNSSPTTISYSTLLGGNGDDLVGDLTVDGSGDAHVAGWTTSADFPTTSDAFDSVLTGRTDGFLTILDPPASGLAFSTYFGGSGDQSVDGIALDSADLVYLGISSSSSDDEVLVPAATPDDRLDLVGADAIPPGARQTLRNVLVRCTVAGSGAGETLYGTPGRDVICAGGGGDTVYGQGGNDVIILGAGDDHAYGGPGIDVILGGDGADVLVGGSGKDLLRGSSGADHLSGGGSPDVLSGQSGSDFLAGGLRGDRINGGPGRDLLRGGSGDDRLLGSTEADSLFGEDGADRLEGGVGRDRCRGGPGVDRILTCED